MKGLLLRYKRQKYILLSMKLDLLILRNKLIYLCLLILVVLIGCADSSNEKARIYVTSPSKDGTLKAIIREGTNDNSVYLLIESTERNGPIATKEINIPKGYHAPIISMSWESSNTLRIEIDHDFGDGNHDYEYNVDTGTLRPL
jgi:hypothetical protein